MTQPDLRARLLILLVTVMTALGAATAHADHLPETQHQVADLAVSFRVAGMNYFPQDGRQDFTVRPGSRISFEAVMENQTWGAATRTNLTVTLPPAFTKVALVPTKADACSLEVVSAPGKMPGSIITCEASYFALNGENAVLLFAGTARSVKFDATAPAEEGEHRLGATLQPVKHWDDNQADNSVTAYIKVARKPSIDDAVVVPRPEADADVIVAPNPRAAPRPKTRPCMFVQGGC